MNKTLYLHAGTPKTGTTYIQEFCDKFFNEMPFRYCKSGRRNQEKLEDRHRELWACLTYALGKRSKKILMYCDDDQKWKDISKLLTDEINNSEDGKTF